MMSRSFGAVIAHNNWAKSEHPREPAQRDTNISGLCSAQQLKSVVTFIETMYKKKNAGFIFVISGLTKIVDDRSHFGGLKDDWEDSSERLRGIGKLNCLSQQHNNDFAQKSSP